MRVIAAALQASQQAIYDALYSQLSSDPTFPFLLRPDSIGTLSGRLEGFYAALSVNYLTGRMNAKLAPHEPHKEAVIGALDLGGSSTQIVFQHVEVSQSHTHPHASVYRGGERAGATGGSWQHRWTCKGVEQAVGWLPYAV